MEVWSLLEMRPGFRFFPPRKIQSTFSVQGLVLRASYVLTHITLGGSSSYYYHHHHHSHF